MSDIFKYYLKRYIEQFTNLESHLICLRDNYGIFKNIEDIDLYQYPHKILFIKNNVLFRTLHEDIKSITNQHYILVFDGQEDSNKLLDFISRSEDKSIHFISIQDLIESVEENLKWNERINEYDSADIISKFNDVIYYGKSLRKNNIERKDVDKIILSSLLDVDATRVTDEGDCYLYYRDIMEIYGGIETFQAKYNTNIKELVIRIFEEYGTVLFNVIKENTFDSFDKLLWVSNVLEDYNKLSTANLRIVLGEEYDEMQNYGSYFDKLLELVNLIGKKDKKYSIQKKDWAEKIILEVQFDILSNEHSYIDMIREKRGSLISITNGIRGLLENYNLEGHKKVYTTKINDLYKLQELIEENNQYRTKNITELTELYRKIIELISKVEFLESESKKIYNLNNYKDWQVFYQNHLFDLQYKLSEIRILDKEHLIEEQRYFNIDKRISKILNKYREYFAKFIEENYYDWINSPYGISRPILNSDIAGFIPHDNSKNFILVFDGMRYDAWNYIVSPYFEKAFNAREVKKNSSFSLLPSITAISREVIYSKFIKEYRKDTVYLTKSESVKNQNEIKEMLLQDKRYNIFVFNMFDKDGHKAIEDFYIFYDKQRKVFENSIAELLKLIPEDANIIITSDHGLMRIDEYKNLKDVDGLPSIKSRYLKSNKNLMLDNCIELTHSSDLEANEKFLLSYDNIGYFVGGGERDFYSHGGAALEEVIVPFIIAKSKKTKEILNINQDDNLKSQKTDILETLILEKGVCLSLGFNLKDKERLILTTLYNLKNQTITTQDIEKKLIKEFGSAGMVDNMIRRLINNLKKQNLDIIDATSAGNINLYKFKHNELKGEK